MTKSKRGVKPRVWRGKMTEDERGPDFFFDGRFFPDIRNNWDYGKPPEFIEVEIREVLPTPKKGRREKR